MSFDSKAKTEAALIRRYADRYGHVDDTFAGGWGVTWGKLLRALDKELADEKKQRQELAAGKREAVWMDTWTAAEAAGLLNMTYEAFNAWARKVGVVVDKPEQARTHAAISLVDLIDAAEDEKNRPGGRPWREAREAGHLLGATRTLPEGLATFREQLNGDLPPAPTLVMLESIRNLRVRELLERHAPKLHHDGGNRAFYMPVTDSIHLPKFQAFETPEAYHATLLHELSHWTGSQQRLARDLTGKFGSERYAREELTAELSSVLIQDRLGISPGAAHFENHVAYIQHWEKLIKDDSKALFRAAAQAEKVIGFLGISEYEYPMLPAIHKEQGAEHGQEKRRVETGRISRSRFKE